MSFDTAKLFLRYQQAGAYPAFPLVAWVPALVPLRKTRGVLIG